MIINCSRKTAKKLKLLLWHILYAIITCYRKCEQSYISHKRQCLNRWLSIKHMLRPVTYLISSWSKLSSSRPERSAMDSVLLNLLQVTSFIFACIFAWAMMMNTRPRLIRSGVKTNPVCGQLRAVQLTVAPPAAAAAPLGEHFQTWAATSFTHSS